ncbi:MAG: class I SAM-dependent methyltransferase [Anaerolineae bacterium]|nr:class I SAM-dependent methyltransferase [Anaerolineae bacterium]
MTDSNSPMERDPLIKKAYATDEYLSVRYRTHELYSQPKMDFRQWVVDTFPWRGDEWVLDIGAGPGSYFGPVQERIPHGRHVAGDLSFGMARQARTHPGAARIQVLNLDAQSLPFPAQTFDVVMANHMLYHIPDIHRALSEIRRVLREDGCLVAAANSQNTMPEFETLVRRACTLLGFPAQDVTIGRGFALENGPILLARYFEAVARYDLPSALHFPEVGPVMEYLNSLRPLREPQLPEGVAWDAFVEVMEKQIERLITHFGELEVHKLGGALIATNGGGFAREYLDSLHSAV